MAYTATVTKQSVSKLNDLIYKLSIRVVVNDGVEDVFTADATENYNINESNLDNVKQKLILQFKEKWDKYSDEYDIFITQAFDNAVSDIQSQANNYINS